jgi:putative transposase
VTRRYQVLPPTAPVPAPDDYLEVLVKRGAQKMLQSAVEREVDDFLGRGRHERSMEFRGHRNGHLPVRQIGVGMGAVEVRMPRVSEVPKAISPEGFSSDIVHRYERRSQTQARLLSRLYLEGLSTGDFEPTFRALVGETAALSPQSILRLKEEWEQEFGAWRKRALKKRYLYLFVDGFYVKAGEEREKTAVLTVLGVREDGQKELLCMEKGYRESTAAWAEVLRSLQARGMIEAPMVVIGDGALGIWAAVDEIFPGARHQRCWNHRAISVIDKLPKRMQGKVRKQLRELAEAPTRAECESLRDKLCAHWRTIGQV